MKIDKMTKTTRSVTNSWKFTHNLTLVSFLTLTLASASIPRECHAKDQMIHDVQDPRVFDCVDDPKEVYDSVVKWNQEYWAQHPESAPKIYRLASNTVSISPNSHVVYDPLKKALPGLYRSTTLSTLTPVKKADVNKCYANVEAIYQELFPGANTHGCPIKFTHNPGDSSCLGVTLIQRTTNLQDVRLGSGPAVYTSSPVIQIYDGGSPDTIHHELAHAYDLSMRGNQDGIHFCEEGFAVAISYILNERFAKLHSEGLRPFTEMCRTPEELKAKVLERMSCQPTGAEYPLAGFFMTQVITIYGPRVAQSMITSKTTQAAYNCLQSNFRVGTITEEEFWIQLFDRMTTWSGK